MKALRCPPAAWQRCQFFAYLAIATSFLGVTLGLFDYLADVFKWDDSTAGRSKTAALTFLPPLVACLLFPTGFVTAIGYVGLAAAVWTAITPAMLLYKARKEVSAKPRLSRVWRLMAGGVGVCLRPHQHCRADIEPTGKSAGV